MVATHELQTKKNLFDFLKHSKLPEMAANSTVMFSGFNPNSRNSSKVLRPPGGGASDIFGLKGEQEEEEMTLEQEDKDNRTVEKSTTIAEESNANNEMAEEGNQPPVEETPAEVSTKPPAESSTTPPPDTSTPSGPSLPPPVARVRGRVPPGGHSSGSFW